MMIKICLIRSYLWKLVILNGILWSFIYVQIYLLSFRTETGICNVTSSKGKGVSNFNNSVKYSFKKQKSYGEAKSSTVLGRTVTLKVDSNLEGSNYLYKASSAPIKYKPNYMEKAFDNVKLVKFFSKYNFAEHNAKPLKGRSQHASTIFALNTSVKIIDGPSFSPKWRETYSNKQRITEKNQKQNLLEGVEVYGTFNSYTSYAVFSTTTDSRKSMTFIFYLPLTILAWKQIGFGSVIVIVGSFTLWNSDPLLSFVLEQMIKLDSILIFLESRAEKNTMLSQIARLFAGNVLNSKYDSVDDIYLITTDTDVWPMHKRDFVLPVNKTIVSLNSECCSPFKHRGRVYRMIPLSNVGMKIKQWNQLTAHFMSSPSSVDDMLTFVVREFGSVSLKPIHKGENVGWYLDQMLISILVAKWDDDHPGDVKYVPRNTGIDRVDRGAWRPAITIDDKIDAHLFHEAYKPEIWEKIIPLLKLMYGESSRRFRYCQYYYKKFLDIFYDEGRPL